MTTTNSQPPETPPRRRTQQVIVGAANRSIVAHTFNFIINVNHKTIVGSLVIAATAVTVYYLFANDAKTLPDVALNRPESSANSSAVPAVTRTMPARVHRGVDKGTLLACPGSMVLVGHGSFVAEYRKDVLSPKDVDVELEAFCLDRTEVTMNDYLDKCPSCSPPCPEIPWETDADQVPARCVTYTDAELYCQSMRRRLPTEDEWAYVVRSAFVNGRFRAYDGVCWNRSEPCAVGTMMDDVTAEGAHDLLANVAEWTSCRSLDCTAGGIAIGGSFVNIVESELSWTKRVVRGKFERFSHVGFRCAASPSPG